ncbi:hypothetical protein ACHAW6_002888 [Cyclotella cf. meneghiniana]
MAPRQSLSSSTTAALSRILLIRHGDRFDYANPTWLDSASQNGTLLTDPPLSALGHKQARETANYLSTKKFPDGVDKILVSPYLRTIQTAVPTAQSLNVPICLEEGLSESNATPGGVLPTPKERFAYFPEIDPSHVSHLRIFSTPGHVCSKTKMPCEGFANEYVKRIRRLVAILEKEYHGKTVVLFSHAASVALVAGLLRCSLRDMKFAPCGVYEMQKLDGGWELVSSGERNEHLSENSATTYPWGYEERHFEDEEGIGMDYFIAEMQKSSL